jgi:phosphatidylserine/phosphatidylglycerophosphate/cardiolipin synthase-like enzyme
MTKFFFGKLAYDKLKEYIMNANSFLHIGTAWMTPDIAKLFAYNTSCKTKTATLSDKQKYNVDSYKILSENGFKVYLNKDAHYKYMLSENCFVFGSANFTHSAFFRQDELLYFGVATEEPLTHAEIMVFHNQMVEKSLDFLDGLNGQNSNNESNIQAALWDQID